jgi:phosphoribosylformylglycinamidine synthase
MKRVKVFVTPKQGVLDPQGQAIQSSLKLIGFDGIADVRLGKFIELEMEDPSKESVDKICQKLLANTVIEDYRFEIE